MRSWNAIQHANKLIWLKGSGTTIRLLTNISLGVITSLLSKMEERCFPISYTDGLAEIYFTYLKYGLEGDYNSYDCKVRIGCNKKFLDRVHQIFVHEVGHHIDEQEGFSDLQMLKDEYDTHPGVLSASLGVCFDNDPAGLEGDGRYSEYFALGFELFHSHDCGLNKLSYPVLHAIIHEHYKNTK